VLMLGNGLVTRRVFAAALLAAGFGLSGSSP
jgi:hypothetical protein